MIKNALRLFVAGIAFFVTIPSTAYAATTNDIIQIGDSDSLVLQIQQALKEKGYFLADLTGYFGPETKEAVLQFQQDTGLTADGQAGPSTCAALLGADYAVLSYVEDGSIVMSEGDSLLPGDEGETISLLQTRLKQLEYYDYDSITSFYGPVTEESVKKFQNSSALPATGIADMETVNALFAEGAPIYTMVSGDSGKSILQLQERLRELGYFNSDSTGYYGTVTIAAIESFQTQNGILADGKAGSETRSVLYSDDAISLSNQEQIIEEAPAADVSSSLLSDSEIIDGALELAYSMLGKEYVYGACGPSSFDCSGFIYYILKNAGLAVNEMSPSAFSNVGDWEKIINIEDLEIGDLVFFQSDQDGNINHMGMYIGGGCFIHASQSIGSVSRSTMTSGYYNDNFAFAKRIA